MRKLILIAILFFCSAQLEAGVIHVTSSQSIQSAINNAVNGDTVLVEAGRYKENLNFLGKAIIVTSLNPDDPNIVAMTIIDGNEPTDINRASVVVFDTNEDNNSVLSGFTITGGSGSWQEIYWEFKGYLWNRIGGGVLCLDGASPTISKNVITGNVTGEGGGIYFYNGSDPVIINNRIENNSALKEHGFEDPLINDANDYGHGDGGAIVGFHYCEATIKDNVIVNNHADWYGGAIHLRQWANGLLEGNLIAGNDSRLGAGLHLTYYSSPVLRSNIIEGNIAGPLGGGGIYIYYHSSPLVERNIISQNISPAGAGIAVYYDSNPVIVNNLISDNKQGEGIKVKGDSTPEITNNTIVKNAKGGIYIDNLSSGLVLNNVISFNSGSYGIVSDTPGLMIIRSNNVWGNDLGNYNPDLGDQTGIRDNISMDPGFVADVNDYHLNYNSPCINKGNSNAVNAGAFDFDGNNRAMGECIDIGAFETWPIWNLDSGGRYAVIQDAIDDSNDGDMVVVLANRYYENLNFNGKNIKLRSVDPNDWDVVEATIIDGNGVDTTVYFGSGEDANCELAGFTITGGVAAGDYGGGIRTSFYFIDANIVPACPVIRRNLITGNVAEKGAGICLYHSSAKIIGNRIVNNRGTEFGRGGGMILIDCVEDVNVVVANNIIAGNSSLFGGGILIQQSPGVEIVNNVIAYNLASWKGKGIYGESGSKISNCIVWGHGGGIEDDLYTCLASYSCIESGVTGAGNISDNPNFVMSGYWDDSGTPGDESDDEFIFGNYHLRPDSACVDIGDNNAIAAVIDRDIDSEERIFGGVVDIGADEVVTNPVDMNNDGLIDAYELSVLASEWLSNGGDLQSDFDESSVVDLLDFADLSSAWQWRGGWVE